MLHKRLVCYAVCIYVFPCTQAQKVKIAELIVTVYSV